MSEAALNPKTFIPADDRVVMANVLNFLDAHERSRGTAAQPAYALVGVEAHDRIELPPEVHQALKRVVAALATGRAVTVAPRSMALTTQQAADVLGVSRPTVKRLIEKGELPAERVGTRHRLLLADVLQYREVRRSRQYDALAETGVDLDSEDEPELIQRQLRGARREAAQRRKSHG